MLTKKEDDTLGECACVPFRHWILATSISLLQQHLASLEVEGNMEGIPHFYLIYIIHYVVVVTQASLQPDNNVFHMY